MTERFEVIPIEGIVEGGSWDIVNRSIETVRADIAKVYEDAAANHGYVVREHTFFISEGVQQHYPRTPRSVNFLVVAYIEPPNRSGRELDATEEPHSEPR